MDIQGGVYVYSVLVSEPTKEYDEEVQTEVSECEDHQSATNPRTGQTAFFFLGYQRSYDLGPDGSLTHWWKEMLRFYRVVRIHLVWCALPWVDTLSFGLCFHHQKHQPRRRAMCGIRKHGAGGSRTYCWRAIRGSFNACTELSEKIFSRHVSTRQEAHTLCGHWPMAAGLPGSCKTLKHINT